MSIKTMDDLFVATSRTSTTPKNIQTCDRAEPRASEPKTRTKSGGRYSTEHRHSKWRRPHQAAEGRSSDASQEEEVLSHLAKNLAQLYLKQASPRRTSWTIGTAA